MFRITCCISLAILVEQRRSVKYHFSQLTNNRKYFFFINKLTVDISIQICIFSKIIWYLKNRKILRHIFLRKLNGVKAAILKVKEKYLSCSSRNNNYFYVLVAVIDKALWHCVRYQLHKCARKAHGFSHTVNTRELAWDSSSRRYPWVKITGCRKKKN